VQVFMYIYLSTEGADGECNVSIYSIFPDREQTEGARYLSIFPYTVKTDSSRYLSIFPFREQILYV
jgi:hypothetical protein